ncbi:MAG: LD-carboxypeptidase [Bacteroidaceae bacterium]|nr:LD-carboxypeptidase [Bacteroidaceae bacterium]
MLRPQPLAAGDTVAIVSPAGAIKEHSIVEGAAATLRRWGLNPIISQHCLDCSGYYAGSVQERTDDLTSILADNNVKAILCAYGGYGCVHILQAVAPFIEKHPKWIIGMSDCSALHAVCVSKDIMSLHAPQCRHLSEFPDDDASTALRNILFGEDVSYCTATHPLNIKGEGEGTLVGGNLSVLCSLMRTPYDIFAPGRILFIEDVNEPLYRIERMLYNLKLAGIFDTLAGIIVGEFAQTKECPSMGGTLYEIIHNIVKEYNIPVCFGFPVGHCKENMPIIEGSYATLKVDDSGVTLKM